MDNKTTSTVVEAAAEVVLFVATLTGNNTPEMDNAQLAQAVIEEQKVEVDTRVEQPAVTQPK